MRTVTLGYACAVALLALTAPAAFDAVAQKVAGMGGGPSGGGASGSGEGAPVKPVPAPRPVSERGAAARSARSIECAQKADAQGLEGEIRKRFLHACKAGR
jgi:hypothetical protein